MFGEFYFKRDETLKMHFKINFAPPPLKIPRHAHDNNTKELRETMVIEVPGLSRDIL